MFRDTNYVSLGELLSAKRKKRVELPPPPRYSGGMDASEGMITVVVFDRVANAFVHMEQRRYEGSEYGSDKKRQAGIMMAQACILFNTHIHFLTTP